MVAPVEVGEGSVVLLVSNGLLKEHKTRDRKAVGAACLAVRVAVNRRRRPGPRSTSEIRAPFQSIPIKLPSYKIGAAQKRPYCQKPRLVFVLGQKGNDYQRVFKMPAKQRFDR